MHTNGRRRGLSLIDPLQDSGRDLTVVVEPAVMVEVMGMEQEEHKELFVNMTSWNEEDQASMLSCGHHVIN